MMYDAKARYVPEGMAHEKELTITVNGADDKDNLFGFRGDNGVSVRILTVPGIIQSYAGNRGWLNVGSMVELYPVTA